jgi:hypothetical protein
MSAQKFFENSTIASVEALMKSQKEQGLKVGDYSELIKAMKNNDTKKFNEEKEKIRQRSKGTCSRNRGNIDPMKKLNLSIMQFNEKVRKFISNYVGSSMDLIGAMGLLAIQLGLNSSALYATLGDPLGLLARLRFLGGATSAARVGAAGAANPFANMGGTMGAAARKGGTTASESVVPKTLKSIPEAFR